ncbi:type I-C CRISPR-associated protein Cas5c [Neisseria lactamica]|uniref:pre-crRNA processing endonuclease n=1 Tax=Neisseria lactamica TaxID=486 RepID=A0A378VMG5_NEILA|nr:type I-C CRISPR-associated protein Cas5c [Neisseria lactamica]SUA15487.1 CRISPR-associated protein Cas5, subtype I-C/DVULG [Neisseria lactamica]SUA17432.1 CRISPR-associated protein Cas5, subtype I-C/DVULG [Neisseria lactamica]
MRFILEISGDLACFTRPELKVERVSYPVITPSAARNILMAILWKPAIRWKVLKIEILKPIQWTNIRRNEVGTKMSERSGSLYIEDNRQQRASMLLKDVAYRIHADFDMTSEAGESDNYVKFAEMFKRRAKKGQYFHQPYLGCREFPCDFRLLEKAEDGLPLEDITQDFGFMLYDMDFSKSDPRDSNNAEPMFYQCKAVNGVITVPPADSEEVKR